MSKFGEKVKSIFTVDYDDYDDDYYDDYDDEEMEVEIPVRKQRETVQREEEPAPARIPKSKPTPVARQPKPSRSIRSSKVVPMHGNGMEVCVIKPTYYESTRDIIDTLLDGKSVVLNLEGMKLDLAQRIIDSVSGGCYAISGNLQKISGYIYLVTPNSVDITGDFQDLVNDATERPSYSRRSY